MSDLIGQRVYYHGSHTHRHGEMTVDRVIVGDERNPYLREGEERYILVYGRKRGDYLANVRRESFTPMSEYVAPKSPTETAHARLSRMFDMGKYGENLAQEILDQYLDEIASENEMW